VLFFVLTLRKEVYRYQFSQFGWTHIGILLVVAQSSAISLNIYEGIVWFLFPALLVIVADTSACLIGSLVGKRPLFRFGNKKTLEGVIGGTICTLIFAYLAAGKL
jgi:phosphatidate cytidylyltransferase